jgi:hypothetical protein
MDDRLAVTRSFRRMPFRLALDHVHRHHTKQKPERAIRQSGGRFPSDRAPNQYLEQILVAKVYNFGGICSRERLCMIQG